MAITYKGDTAFFDNTCSVEEAEEFVEWLKSTKVPKIDLDKMEHMHTALFQAILFFRPKIIKYPKEQFWQEILC